MSCVQGDAVNAVYFWPWTISGMSRLRNLLLLGRWRQDNRSTPHGLCCY